jgi:hypothetical protein
MFIEEVITYIDSILKMKYSQNISKIFHFPSHFFFEILK